MAFAAGTITQISQTYNSAVLSCTPASGGTGPYTYQWYESTVNGFTPGAGNIVAGATALNFSATGLSPSTPYYFVLVATDTGASNVTAPTSQFTTTTYAAPLPQLPLSNVIVVSVATAQQGVNNYNTSNLGLFTDEIPAASFGNLGYALYLSPTQVGVDFGTSSKTYLMANAVFSQQPNILVGGGALVVILMEVAVQNIAFSAISASGTFVFNYGGNASSAINWNDTASMIQTKLQLVPGLSEVLVTGSIVGRSLNIQFNGVYGALSLATITSNTLQTAGSASVTSTVTTVLAGESLGAAITRSSGLVQYFGIIVTQTLDNIGATDFPAAAAIIQPLNKIGIFVSHVAADLTGVGLVIANTAAGFTQTRCLFYDDPSPANCRAFCAAYAGLAFSVNFSGSNTTINMHLKTLVGVSPDPNITQTILNNAVTAGADTYPSLQGVPKVYASGANNFYDQVYNTQWFAGAIQVAAFNFLAQTNTKVPQTEEGMYGYKAAIRNICQQAVVNGFLAPGSWNSSTTFGNPTDLVNNVAQVGYYIYSQPVAQQSQANRAARAAPVVQIAGKEAGAIDSGTIIVYLNP